MFLGWSFWGNGPLGFVCLVGGLWQADLVFLFECMYCYIGIFGSGVVCVPVVSLFCCLGFGFIGL